MSPNGAAQEQIDDWFARGDAPTGLVHSASYEVQIRDLLHTRFHDHFAPEAVVAMLYDESLQTGYAGFSDAAAVVVKFETIARRAIELLFRPRTGDEIPTRETQEAAYFRYRRDGVWLTPTPAARPG